VRALVATSGLLLLVAGSTGGCRLLTPAVACERDDNCRAAQRCGADNVCVARDADAGPREPARDGGSRPGDDAGSTDAGSTDAGSTDAGSTDAGNADAGNTDASSADAGQGDGGATGADAGLDAGADADAGPLARFSSRHSLTIPSGAVSAPLTDFPLLVAPGNAVASPGDVAFADGDGALLDFEVESTNPPALWVRVPLVRDDADTLIWLYYDNAASPLPRDEDAVWDDDFAMVLHLSDVPALMGAAADSTQYGLDGTYRGVIDTESVPGVAGRGVDLDGDDWIDGSTDARLDFTGAFTAEGWFNLSASTNGYLISHSGYGGDRGWDLSFNPDTNNPIAYLEARVSGDGADPSLSTGETTVSLNTGYYAAVTFDPGVRFALFVDGQLVLEKIASVPAQVNVASVPLVMSRHGAQNSGWVDGVVDELRVSTVARSDAWIAAQGKNLAGTLSVAGVSEAAP
jgi:hypothetical protein